MPLEIRKKNCLQIRDIEHANLAKMVFKSILQRWNTSNDLAKFIKSKIYGK